MRRSSRLIRWRARYEFHVIVGCLLASVRAISGAREPAEHRGPSGHRRLLRKTAGYGSGHEESQAFNVLGVSG